MDNRFIVYSFPMKETIVESKVCTHCWISFDITDQDMQFYDKVSPVFGWEKLLIPSPRFCPDCRQQRRLSFRNERKLYHRTCDSTGKNVISIYAPSSPYKIYEHTARWSDAWDPMSYGQDRDTTRSFFVQREELYAKVPKIALNGHDSNENSPYTNYTVWTKNGYLVFGGGYTENVYYSTLLLRCKDCLDSHFTVDSEQCYETTYGNKCYSLHFSNHCDNCGESYFLEDCTGCHNCFACSHLDNAKYHVFNRPVSKEEYEVIIQRFWVKDPALLTQIQEFFSKIPYNQRYITHAEECIGHNIRDAKYCNHSFNLQDAENLKYCNVALGGIRDSYDSEQGGLNVNLCYEFMTASMNIYHCLWSFVIRENSQYLIYCWDMSNCTHCFGCVWLRNVSYCILNKQYTKEEYEKVVPQIIERMKADWEWGEFFPSALSPFGYNETIAYEHFPLTKEAAKHQWFKRCDYEAPFPQVEKTITAEELPSIQTVTDDILQTAILCKITGKPFRIIKKELEFYRKHNLPLPTKHPDQRHKERMQKINPRKLWERACAKCGKDIQTTYTSSRPEIVYCEACYNHEIYW